jgi:Reverse transcriptase (RNA-dependent DNA polymerase)
LKLHSYIEWPRGILEFEFLNKEETSTTCAELTRAMYGNIDVPLQWMKIFSALLKGTKSHLDPCIFYMHKGGKLVLILLLYVDDTLCAGEKEEVEWAFRTIESELKIERHGQLKKQLGILDNWKKDETGKKYLEAYMPKIVKEICEKEEESRNSAHQEHQEKQ